MSQITASLVSLFILLPILGASPVAASSFFSAHEFLESACPNQPVGFGREIFLPQDSDTFGGPCFSLPPV
jgi:hypothetical protein